MNEEFSHLTELDLFQCLEHAYIQFKSWHHKTKSYAEHKTLNENSADVISISCAKERMGPPAFQAGRK